jgi:hypothetical protein
MNPVVVKCSVCGRPGRVRTLPGVPASGCYCDDHAPTFALKPLPVVVTIIVLLFVFWLLLGWLAD